MRIQIVPPGEVWRDNLLYTVLDAFGFTMHWAVRLGFVALALAIAYGFRLDRKRRPVRLGPIPTGTTSTQAGTE